MRRSKQSSHEIGFQLPADYVKGICYRKHCQQPFDPRNEKDFMCGKCLPEPHSLYRKGEKLEYFTFKPGVLENRPLEINRSYSAISRLVDMDLNTYHKWKQVGKGRTRISRIEALARVLKLEVSELIDE